MLLAARELRPAADAVDLYVALAKRDSKPGGFELAREARRAGLQAQVELAGRSLKGQLKHADRIRARFVAIVDNGHVALKDMESGEQRDTELAGRHPDDPARGAAAVKHAPRPNTYRDAWAGSCAADRAGTRRGSRAGCTAAATTAA